MLDVELVKEYLEEVRTFAKQVGKEQSLEENLAYLGSYADHENEGLTKCVLYKDWAPYSFEFTMFDKKPDGTFVRRFNGGLIFHGDHDGHGSGSAPTFSVCLSPTDGWSIHT